MKIVLLAYSRGITSSRVIESLCRRDVQFMAVSGDKHPQFTTIAGFVSRSADEIAGLFTEVLLVCSLQGLIGREMFAIDGVKHFRGMRRNRRAGRERRCSARRRRCAAR